MWVPEQNASALQSRLQTDLAAAVPGTEVQVYRSDYKAYETIDPLLLVRLIFGGVAVLVLLLGALSLFNISMVTLRQRIREIGVRRSFGATEGRIFFGVMLESVVGTAVAGAVGVLFAVILLRNPIAINIFASMGVTDPPPFPLDAAVWGIVAAVIVGALAGLGPALVAVRIKVIDAIRF
jgi:putative ABC transport system permease protein